MVASRGAERVMHTASVPRDQRFDDPGLITAKPSPASQARARVPGLVAVGGVIPFAVLVLVLPVLKPEFPPSRRFLSEYSIGLLSNRESIEPVEPVEPM